MTRNESNLQFQRRLIQVALKAPRMEALNMMGIVYSNLMEFIRVRVPLDENIPLIMESFEQTLSYFNWALEKKFTNLYVTNDCDLHGSLANRLIHMAAEETGDANLVSAANYKWVLEKAEKAMTEEFGMMINNMYYHPALIYKAARDLMMKPQAMAALVEDARLSEVPEATSSVLTRLTSLLNGGTCLTNMRVTGNRTHISAPNSFIGNNQVALNIVESWLRNPNVYTKSDVEVIFHLEEKKEDDYEPVSMSSNSPCSYSFALSNCLILQFDKVAKFIIDHTPDEVAQKLKYEEDEPSWARIHGHLWSASSDNHQSTLLRTPLDTGTVVLYVMKELGMEELHMELDKAQSLSDILKLVPKVKDYYAARDIPRPIQSFMTIYRTDAVSPDHNGSDWTIRGINAKFMVLMACLLGINAHFFVEIRARDSERNNLNLVRLLTSLDASVSVVPKKSVKTKVHAKAWTFRLDYKEDCDRYVNVLSTGNFQESSQDNFSDTIYLEKTRRLNPQLLAMWETLFMKAPIPEDDGLNTIKFAWGPNHIKNKIIHAIYETYNTSQWHNPETMQGHIRIKCNHLTDKDVIKALIDVARAGVKVDLMVRTTCTMPLTGTIPNLRIRSIAGKYLEHDRWYLFSVEIKDHPEEPCEYSSGAISSADLMERNLEKRIELYSVLPSLYTGKLVRTFDTLFEGKSDPARGFFNFKLN